MSMAQTYEVTPCLLYIIYKYHSALDNTKSSVLGYKLNYLHEYSYKL